MKSKTGPTLACLVLGHLDYEAQLIAIRELIDHHRKVGEGLSDKIKALDAEARRATGDNEHIVDEWVEALHHSVFQDAAHSMAATGMLAPFAESLFKVGFRGIGTLLRERNHQLETQVRSSMDAECRWDCSLISARRDGRHVTDLVGGVSELIAALDLGDDLPANLKPTLAALFGYRNKIFHHGFEWPEDVRTAFEKRVLAASWPPHWFRKSTSDDAPWIFYLSEEFVEHCLDTFGGVLDGFGAFIRRLE